MLALQDEPSAFGMSPEEEAKFQIEAYRERLGPEPAHNAIYGAFDTGKEGELVAVVGIERSIRVKMRHRSTIWGCFTLRAQRGRGLSQKLLRMAIDHALGVWHSEVIVLSVEATNEAAKAAYRKVGFKSWGREPKVLKVGHVLHDLEHMVLNG